MKVLSALALGVVCAGFAFTIQAHQTGEHTEEHGSALRYSISECLSAARGGQVSAADCEMDTDMDGVADPLDVCPDTKLGVRVGGRGCDLDLDGDGVPYYLDRCQITPPNSEVDQEGCLVKAELGEVYFAFDKADLTAEGKRILDRINDSLRYRDEVTAIVISGHTDNVGPRAYNQRLSQARAQSVLDYLTAIGSPKPMSAKGYGETRPVASNANRAGRQKNRRVELELRRDS